MAKETKIGSNRTGIQMSPKDSKEMIEAAANAMPTSEGDHMSLALLRSNYTGWELLIALAESSGHDDLAKRFQLALAEEAEHLTQIRAWVQELTMAEASVMPA